MPLYRVTMDVEFTIKASSREVVANRIKRMLREARFEEKNFEWGIVPIKPEKEVSNEG